MRCGHDRSRRAIELDIAATVEFYFTTADIVSGRACTTFVCAVDDNATGGAAAARAG